MDIYKQVKKWRKREKGEGREKGGREGERGGRERDGGRERGPEGKESGERDKVNLVQNILDILPLIAASPSQSPERGP